MRCNELREFAHPFGLWFGLASAARFTEMFIAMLLCRR